MKGFGFPCFVFSRHALRGKGIPLSVCGILAGLCLACRKAPSPVGPTTLSEAVAYSAPAAWSLRDAVRGTDFSVHMASGPYEIRLQLLGSEGSLFPRPEALLKSIGSQADLKGPRPARLGGAPADCYEASRTAETAAPGEPSEPGPVREEFCLVSLAGGRYLIAGVEARGTPGAQEPPLPLEWRAFLASLSVNPGQSL